MTQAEKDALDADARKDLRDQEAPGIDALVITGVSMMLGRKCGVSEAQGAQYSQDPMMAVCFKQLAKLQSVSALIEDMSGTSGEHWSASHVNLCVPTSRRLTAHASARRVAERARASRIGLRRAVFIEQIEEDAEWVHATS